MSRQITIRRESPLNLREFPKDLLLYHKCSSSGYLGSTLICTDGSTGGIHSDPYLTTSYYIDIINLQDEYIYPIHVTKQEAEYVLQTCSVRYTKCFKLPFPGQRIKTIPPRLIKLK